MPNWTCWSGRPTGPGPDITIETCGAPSVGIDFTGMKDGVSRRAVERLILSGGITKILEVNMPDREWDSTHTLLNQLIKSCDIA